MNTPIFELKQLESTDGQDIYEMLQEIPIDENGFENHFFGLSFEEYKEQLKLKSDQAEGRNLAEGHVPQTFFWLYVNKKPVGVSKLRHYLTDHLREHGGNIGYGIKPSDRGKGYATKLLELTLEEAKKLGLEKVLITCDVGNMASARVAQKNGGVLERETKETKYYWIEL